MNEECRQQSMPMSDALSLDELGCAKDSKGAQDSSKSEQHRGTFGNEPADSGRAKDGVDAHDPNFSSGGAQGRLIG